MKERIAGYILIAVLAAFGGAVAGMMWMARIETVDPVASYCRGNIEGFYMTQPRQPVLSEMEEAEANCVVNLGLNPGYLAEYGYRGPLLP